MSADMQFTVSPGAVRSAAAELGDRGQDARKVADRAQAAQVETRSWGLLGFELGLWAVYGSAQSAADQSIGKVSAFLADAERALRQVADDYERTDQAAADLFDGILRALP